MSKPLWGTLQSLQDAARDHVFSREVFCQAPEMTFSAEGVCRGSTEMERQAVEMAIAEGVQILKRERPRHGRKAMERFIAQATEQSRQSAVLVCGFDPVSVILGWLLWQALSWLWSQWMRHDEMPALICGMAGAGS